MTLLSHGRKPEVNTSHALNSCLSQIVRLIEPIRERVFANISEVVSRRGKRSKTSRA